MGHIEFYFSDWDIFAIAEFPRVFGNKGTLKIVAYNDHITDEEKSCKNVDPECGHQCTRPKGHEGMCEVKGIRPRSRAWNEKNEWVHARWDQIKVITEAF